MSGFSTVSTGDSFDDNIRLMTKEIKHEIERLKAQLQSNNNKKESEKENSLKNSQDDLIRVQEKINSLLASAKCGQGNDLDVSGSSAYMSETKTSPRSFYGASSRLHGSSDNVRTKQYPWNPNKSTTSQSSTGEDTIESLSPKEASKSSRVKYMQMSARSNSTDSKSLPSERHQEEEESEDESTASEEDAAEDSPHVNKYSELEKKLVLLQERCIKLEEENKETESKNGKKIRNLKKRNGELANIARMLEVKAKGLHEQLNKKSAESLDRDHKKAIAKVRTRMDAELTRKMNEKDVQMKTLRSQIEDLKRALKQANTMRMKQTNSEEDYLSTNSAKILRDENLRLHKLASAASSKVIVRSLSTPVTARQKILEETNRSLRRQIASLEEELRGLNGGENYDDLTKKVQEYKAKNNQLERSLKELKIDKTSTETELQTAKVEASDLSLKLSDQMSCYKQLQHEYSTVHERLTNVINERDEANVKYNKMDNDIKILEERKKQTEDELKNEKDEKEKEKKSVEEYQLALKNLQEKVFELEKQCNEQREQNEKLTKQLTLNKPEVNIESSKPSSLDTTVENDKEETPPPLIMEHNSDCKLRVYIAKYSYNPYEGPNDNPECELPLVAGDYVYVYGQMDEDGFFEGELINGRRGLVPSNFIEVAHEVHHQQVKITPDIRLSDVSDVSSCTTHSELLTGKSVTKSSSYVLTGVLPYPRKLKIDKQLSHSLIIGWMAPVLQQTDAVEEYHVFVNDTFRSRVNGNKTKAVVENIHHDKAYRISVCVVTSSGISDANLCVISHGKASDLNPTAVRTEHLTSTGARILWTPASSDVTHVVTVEEQYSDGYTSHSVPETLESYVVPPPLYYHTLTNLRSDVAYKVSVSIRGKEHSSSHTRFTTPAAGPPDPPLSVQVEESVDEKHIKVTWLPVTLSTYGTSNGVAVCGYSIFIGETKLAELNTAVVDQCLIPSDVFAQAAYNFVVRNQNKARNQNGKKLWNVYKPPCVTMTTLADTEQISERSDPCIISHEFFDKLCNLIPDDRKERNYQDSPRLLNDQQRYRSTMQYSLESTDLDVSFSSDFSAKQNSARQSDEPVEKSGKKARPDWAQRPAKGKMNSLKATRVVPSIEITHETSSEEDQLHKSRKSLINGHKNGPTHSKIEAMKQPSTDEVVSSSQESSDSIQAHRKHRDDYYIQSEPAMKSASAANVIQPSTTTQSYLTSASDHKFRKPQNAARRSHSLSSNRSQESHKSSSRSSARYSRDVTRQSTYSDQSDMGDTNMRLFVALYDYDPSTMSPNTDAANEELSFIEGQLLKIYGDKDADGFYNGETHFGKQGLVPCNLVSEVEVDNMQMLNELHERGHLPSSSPDDDVSVDKDNVAEEQRGEVDKRKVRFFVAMFDYDPSKLSPNIDVEVELPFRKDDIITITGEMDEDGFFKGSCDGRNGLVPSNYLKEITEEEAKKLTDKNETSMKVPVDSGSFSMEKSAPHSPRFSQSKSVALPSTSENNQPPSYRSHTSPRKRGGILSKGKKFLRKLGSSSDLKYK